MKTRVYISLVILLAIPLIYLSSCSKVKELTAVDVSMKLPRHHFTYTATNLKSDSGEVILYSGHVTVNLDSVLNAYGLSSGIIQTTIFTYLAVTIEQPPDSTFHWLTSMRSTVSDNANFQPENLIGSVTNSNPTAKTVVVTLNNLNIRPYLTNPSFYVRVYAVLNGPLPAVTVGMFLDGTIQLHIEPL
ncbi:MAG: hypothetical protein NTY96_10620 [Bacteroidetes bacterium]|nr:hypothetical protein [Bacteroidota bacterium]